MAMFFSSVLVGVFSAVLMMSFAALIATKEVRQAHEAPLFPSLGWKASTSATCCLLLPGLVVTSSPCHAIIMGLVLVCVSHTLLYRAFTAMSNSSCDVK